MQPGQPQPAGLSLDPTKQPPAGFTQLLTRMLSCTLPVGFCPFNFVLVLLLALGRFITDMGNAGFRVASVRRTNPLLAMAQEDDGNEDDAIGYAMRPHPTPNCNRIGE